MVQSFLFSPKVKAALDKAVVCPKGKFNDANSIIKKILTCRHQISERKSGHEHFTLV